jgi:hypothetical protein
MSISIGELCCGLLARIGAAFRGRSARDARGSSSATALAGDEREVDRWIQKLGLGSDLEGTVDKLVSLGEPALRRLLEIYDGKVPLPGGRDARRASVGRNWALTRLAKMYPDAVLEFFRNRTYLNASLNAVLRMSGDERLESLAADAAKRSGWINVPDRGHSTPPAADRQRHVAVDQAEIDRWIERLGSDWQDAEERLVSFGEPALGRLFELVYNPTAVPFGPDERMAMSCRLNALARLTRRHPDLVLELLKSRPYMPIAVMAAFRQWGDFRLKAIADEASKNNMRVRGVTSD